MPSSRPMNEYQAEFDATLSPWVQFEEHPTKPATIVLMVNLPGFQNPGADLVGCDPDAMGWRCTGCSVDDSGTLVLTDAQQGERRGTVTILKGNWTGLSGLAVKVFYQAGRRAS